MNLRVYRTAGFGLGKTTLDKWSTRHLRTIWLGPWLFALSWRVGK